MDLQDEEREGGKNWLARRPKGGEGEEDEGESRRVPKGSTVGRRGIPKGGPLFNLRLGGSQYRIAYASFLCVCCRQQRRVIVGDRRPEIYICILTCGETYVRHVVWDTLIVERIMYTMCDGGELLRRDRSTFHPTR